MLRYFYITRWASNNNVTNKSTKCQLLIIHNTLLYFSNEPAVIITQIENRKLFASYYVISYGFQGLKFPLVISCDAL